jgi:XTP/dITP diphosphohydrolase
MQKRLFTESQLIVATHNQGKLREIRALLANQNIEVLSAGDLGLDEPEEIENSFTGNARLKARAASNASGLVALADDSGLVVDALGGAPGIYSARWAGPKKDFSFAMQTVQARLSESASSDRRAHFICSLSLVWPDDFDVTVEGRIDGQLVWPPRGNRGFGYDPIFLPDGYDLTFGEMDPDQKHAIGHRANAFTQLLRDCFGT